MKSILKLMILTIIFSSPVFAQDDDIIDFSDQMTPTCEITGLTATPPAGWFNVPIDSGDKAISGCQMMRTGEQEELVGILRLLSAQVEETEESPPWYAIMIAIEQEIIGEMGYVIGEVLWSRKDVPVSGSGFANARAVGLSATIEGSDVPQEVHFLVFDNGPQKFIITLLTPAQSVDDSLYYKRNTDDFGVLIRTLTKNSES